MVHKLLHLIHPVTRQGWRTHNEWGEWRTVCTLFDLGKMSNEDWINSLWPNDVIWWHRSGSTLVQVMACCLMAPSHYLNQCSLIISKVQILNLARRHWFVNFCIRHALIRHMPKQFIHRSLEWSTNEFVWEVSRNDCHHVLHKPCVWQWYAKKIVSDLVFFCPQVMVPSKDADWLQGFAETHVVTEDAMHLVLVEKRQPVDTVLIKIKNNMKNWMN